MAGEFKAPSNVDVKLQESAQKYRKDLLMMPILGLGNSTKHMTLRPGVRGKETVGELTGDMQFGPYSETRVGTNDVKVVARVLETFLGSVVKPFSPNNVWSTVYGANITKGDALKNTPFTLQVLAYLCAKLGANLNKVLWTAVRNADGTDSKDLFNGFGTILKKEITATNIDVSKGNKFIIPKITKENAVDVLKSINEACSDELQGGKRKMFVPKAVYTAYCEDYKATTGATPYNQEYKQTFVEGSEDLCEIVPLSNMKASPHIVVTPQSNMLVGFGAGADNETISVEKYHPFVLDFVATTWFGVEFETISPEKLLVATIDNDAAVV